MKYGCSILFDTPAQKTKEWAAMVAACNDELTAKFGAKAATMKVKTPFLKGDDYSQYPDYAGTVFLRVNTEFKPGFVDRKGSEIAFDVVEDEIYSGCYAKATLNCYAYDTSGNRGVAFGLRNIQKLGDGDRIDGRVSAENDFGPVEDDGGDLDGQFARDLVG
jgi:ssDNA-binding protein